MSRRVRLIAWSTAATGALAWPLFLERLAWVQIVFVVALFTLLWTTPGDAIRLPRRLSDALALAGVLLIQLIGLKQGMTLPWAVVAISLIAVLLLLACDCRSVSPWWIVPALWGWWTASGWLGVLVGGLLGIASLLIAVRHIKREPRR